MKKAIIIILVIIIAALSIYFLAKSPSGEIDVTPSPSPQASALESPSPVMEETGEAIIGKSVEGRDITAYRYGTGDTEILFVGGIHGGYSWNTSLVAYELMDYLDSNSDKIPSNLKVTVIPAANPDGIAKVTNKDGRFTKADVSSSQTLQTEGRFNANEVDLNRNFDCNWKENGKWQSKTVSGGTSAFSEPESQALKTYVESHNPKAVVVWYSAAGGVFASQCDDGILPETKTLTDVYSKASGYEAYDSFDFYEVTGDMVNWLAKKNIAGISILLSNHTDTEWTKNQRGIEAVLSHYAK
ncbi:MAG: hypothetical protein COU07_00045 [Candidatus Harrisonbacteria bacterium CG10_big_fil_rev_8_21_14_0_10_40_38]|uniref:Peptidase M14 domain-containing protein n=1 Tax=Candidatus Harrisonbacteria bacterium CG10_big_fil_rev_8_21_14_0_10_40_38 TaxID=1974583 RepID=A0A2H0US86_9BACT|nr:MAG: hypothetical protein COU07_00045 [Candidatus Harrisonbacteria bacterium CG10_big_fil_rev_8_21_14_0_10_40_38]